MLTDVARRHLAARADEAKVNDRYKGVERVRSDLDPAAGCHSLPAEINKRPHMDEPACQRPAGFAPQDGRVKA